MNTYTLTAAARRLGISRKTLTREVVDKNISHNIRRNRIVFLEKDITEYEKRNRVNFSNITVTDLQKTLPFLKWKP